MGRKLKHPFLEGETAIERKRRLRRSINQKYRLKIYPNRKVGSHRSPGFVTKEYIVSCCKTDPVSGCWIWQKGKANGGYGAIRENDRIVRAHRRAYELWVGTIPDGLFACHKCDNPPCCNPDHLFLGTDAENKADCYQKGRMPLGPNRPDAKLTADQVREVRNSNLTFRELAEMYNVSAASLWRVKNLITYRSVL